MGELFQEHGTDLTIDLISCYLLNHEDPEIIRVGRQLYPFTSAGEYGAYFNGKSNVDLNTSQFTVVELQSLKSKPLLQRAVLFIIMYSITEAMAKMPKNVRKLIILDEAWQMLAGSPEVAKFMETLYRTVRKQGGSACVVTQSINDLYGSDSGIAIAENSPNKFFLGQTKTSIQRARSEGKISLDDHGFELLEHVSTQKGFYSEMLIMKDKGYGVARFVVDRFTQLLCTTDSEESSLLEKIEKSSGCGPDEAVNIYMEYEERGALSQIHNDYNQIAA
jgi:conjugal transfer ATP-binding protein TraC